LTDLTPQQRFWLHTHKDGPVPTSHPEFGNCWLNDLATVSGGYPAFKIDGRTTAAHRYAIEQAMGRERPPGSVVLHTCDVRTCVRNDEAGVYVVGERVLPRWGHLVLGTHADNIADAFAKGRARRVGHPQRGSANGNARLREVDVRLIRRRCMAGENQSAVAREYGVSSQTVNAIMRGVRWRSVR
jgi:hypothetical protein